MSNIIGGIGSYIGLGNTTPTQQPQQQKIPLEHRLNELEINNMMTQSRLTGEVDVQLTGKATDSLMMSQEAQREMNLISGTGGNDTITSSFNQEDGSITININGQETTYTAEQALNGFKVELGDGNDSVDLSAIYTSVLMNAGEGDNNITLGQSRNIVTAGDGNNTIKAEHAHRSSITTGNGNNSINVTSDTNTVNTGSGRDSIILAGQNSKVNSGDGTDIINTISEENNINAGAGNDVIISSGKKDKIYGGDGNDFITAGNGDTYIEGGKGDDNIKAGNGNNVIYGLDGNDKIKVGNGDNYIDGGKDNDNITVGTGKNIVFGGLGDDTIDAKKSSGKVFDDKNGGTINASENMEVKRYDSTANANLGHSMTVRDTESDDFKMRVESDKEALKATESGQKLLSELDKSGHKVTIHEIDINNGYEQPAKSEDYDKQFVTPDGKRGEGTDTEIGYNPSYNA
ncbi:hypothetical protein IJJ97_01475 [bacterium]|nr:hypothetical protein [bacterium]